MSSLEANSHLKTCCHSFNPSPLSLEKHMWPAQGCFTESGSMCVHVYVHS